MGNARGVMLLLVPLALTMVCGVLALATYLERKRVEVTVRLTVRSAKASPELAEALVARELAPVLAAHGFGR